MATKISSHEATQPRSHVEIIPFVECYTAEHRRAVVEGLRTWFAVSGVTRAIVVTGEGFKGLKQLPKLGETPIDILAGLKTLNVLNVDWSDGWARIATHFAAAFALTGTTIGVLENETALHPFSVSGGRLDSRAMFAGIKSLPGEPWVYLPEVLCNSPAVPTREHESGQYVRALAGGNKAAKFITGYAAHPRAAKAVDVQALRTLMVHRVGERRMVPMLNVRVNPAPGRFQPFTVAQAKKHMEATGGIHLVQPGLAEFQAVAAAWRETK